MPKTIFITGTSSGLGQLTALHFAAQGWRVVATMRAPERDTVLRGHENITVLKLDVTNVREARAAAEQAIATYGAIDVVVNNAGAGAFGPLELADERTIDWQFALNVRGPINVIRAFLPHFRANKGGMFINISSLMGVTTGTPIASLYNMSKFALEGLTEGLYYELKPLNIELRLIEQAGSTGNNFLKNVVYATSPDIRDYDEITGKVRALFSAVEERRLDERLDDPQDIVDQIYALATGTSQRFRTLIGKMSTDLVTLRGTVPIEEYLETIAAQFA